jgi:RsiW-degrading membrane proteinase PrsW (M82 family)
MVTANILIDRAQLADGSRLALAVACAALTAIPALAVVIALDQYEIEPLRHMLLVFYAGASIAPGISFLVAPQSVFVAALIEEALKALILLAVCRIFSAEVDEPIDALIYAFLIAIGFGFTENIQRFAAYPGFPSDLSIDVNLLVLRFGAMIGHLTFTGAFGTAVAIRFDTGSKLSVPAGFVAAVVLHCLWDSIPLAGGASFVLRFVPFAVLVLFAARRFHRHESVLIRQFGAYDSIIQEFVEGEQEEFPDRIRRFEVLGDLVARPWSAECRARYRHFQAVSKLAFLRWNAQRRKIPAGEIELREIELISQIRSTHREMRDCQRPANP